MRLALAALALVIASPAGAAGAEDPGRQRTIAVEAAATSALIQSNACPKLRVNEVRLDALLRSIDLDAISVIDLYRADYYGYLRALRERARKDSDGLCDAVWDRFGESGLTPHIVEKRT